MEGKSVTRDAIISAATVLAGSFVTLAMLRGHALFGIDDANIIHVYARNLAEGHGPVYYPGGERVEGSTSTLWTLINALVWKIFGAWPPVYKALCLLTTIGAVFAALQLWRHIQIASGLTGRAGEIAIVLAFLGWPSFFAWNVWSLMDVTLWTLAVAGLTYFTTRLVSGAQSLRRDAVLLATFSAVAVASRPEGVAFALGMAVIGAVLVALAIQSDKRRGLLTAFAASAGAAVVTFLALTGIRLAVFGYPFPNTYYAKVTEDLAQRLWDGGTYLLHGLTENYVLTIGVLIVLRWAGGTAYRSLRSGGLSPVSASLLVLPLAICGMFAIVILSGGDHFSMQRFLQPLAPLAVIGFGLAAAGLPKALEKFGVASAMRPATVAVLAACLVLPANAFFNRSHWAIGFEFALANHGRAVGDDLSNFTRASGTTSLGVIAAGGVALTYDNGPIYDLMGLNWTRMAHSDAPKAGVKNHAAFDPEIFWEAEPEIMISGAQQRNGLDTVVVGEFEDRALKGLLRTERFQAFYAPVVLPTDDGQLFVFARREWLARAQLGAARQMGWAEIDVQQSDAIVNLAAR